MPWSVNMRAWLTLEELWYVTEPDGVVEEPADSAKAKAWMTLAVTEPFRMTVAHAPDARMA